MGQKNYEEEDRLNFKWGCIHLLIFSVLIAGGIICKRVYGHPEFMMAFHGPAAIFLVVGGMKISARMRRRNKALFIKTT